MHCVELCYPKEGSQQEAGLPTGAGTEVTGACEEWGDGSTLFHLALSFPWIESKSFLCGIQARLVQLRLGLWCYTEAGGHSLHMGWCQARLLLSCLQMVRGLKSPLAGKLPIHSSLSHESTSQQGGPVPSVRRYYCKRQGRGAFCDPEGRVPKSFCEKCTEKKTFWENYKLYHLGTVKFYNHETRIRAF